MNTWWGEPWPAPNWRAPVCEDDRLRVPVPVGEECWLCDETIVETDQGQSMVGILADLTTKVMHAHRECLIRNVLGCSAHLRGEPHDETVPYREDARRVQAMVESGQL